MIYTLNEYKKENNVKSLIDGWMFDSVFSYFVLSLMFDDESIVLPIGDGSVTAPCCMGAYVHNSYDGAELIGIYDTENEEVYNSMVSDLNDLFPVEPPQDETPTERAYNVHFGADSFCNDYTITLVADDERDAIRQATLKFAEENPTAYNLWSYVYADEVTPSTGDRVLCLGGGVYIAVHDFNNGDYATVGNDCADFLNVYNGNSDGEPYECTDSLYSIKADRIHSDDMKAIYDDLKTLLSEYGVLSW